MSKKILIAVIIILVIVVGFLLTKHFIGIYETPEQRKYSEELKRKAENAERALKEYEDLEEETNKKINKIVSTWK